MKLFKRIGSMAMILAVLGLVSCGDKNQGEAQAAPATALSNYSYSTQYNFSTMRLDGSELNLDEFRGKVVIVDMWDTWCPPCRQEIPHFIELYSEYKDKGFVMVGLAFGREGKPAVEQFIANNGINYINGVVNQDVFNKLGQPSGIPTTYVIDQNGNIYKKYIGYRDKSIFENDIRTLLNI